ncbi:MAG: flavoprotein [Ignisphaera sp.]|uniref:4Fe-4S ferredoxin-type domain-containing protein n=1 Tax=Ignisphaera aggregans TaxID=334771 RepID=A0A7J3JSV9_9CREN
MINIAWCITGGGLNLRAVASTLGVIRERYRVNVTLFLTKWGFEVSRIFGVLNILKSIASGGYYQEFLVEEQGMYYIGRLNMKRYSILIIAPATANSVAKMVLGIADNIASALYSQAIKSSIPVVILPTDIPGNDGFIETETPCYIDRAVCSLDSCGGCLAVGVCPVNAIVTVDGVVRIDLSKCIGCEHCIYVCPRGAVRCWEKVKLMPRDVDVQNIEKLRRSPYTYVVSSVSELEDTVKRILKL